MTSKAAAAQAAARSAPLSVPCPPPDAELESFLEEALVESEEDESPKKRTQDQETDVLLPIEPAAEIAAAAPPLRKPPGRNATARRTPFKAAAKAPQMEAQESKSVIGEAPKQPQVAGPVEEAQAVPNECPRESAAPLGTAAEADVEIQLDLSGDTGRGSIADRSIQAALKSIGFASWEDFAADVMQAAIAAGTAAAPTRRKPRGKSSAQGTGIKVSDVMNRNSSVYHAKFTKAYQAARQALTRQEEAKRKAEKLETHSALVPRWSSLTAAEHTWYLQHKGYPLLGSDAERFAVFKAKIEVERREYWEAVHSAAQAQRNRYLHLTERQGAQLQADLKLKRKRAALEMPREWRLRSIIGLEGINKTRNGDGGNSGNARKPLLALERELLRKGEAPILRELSPGTSLPGNKVYLPVQLGEGAGRRAGAAGEVYRKACAAELWKDPGMAAALETVEDKVVICATAGAMLCMLRSAVLQHGPAWEIPIMIENINKEDLNLNSLEQRRIFLGKPFLPAKEALREKQRRLQKYAVLSEALQQAGKGASGGIVPREALYWLTSVAGGIPLAIRTHSRVLITAPGSELDTKAGAEGVQNPSSQPTTAASSVFVASPEYLPEPDTEQDTAEELASWWAKLLLTPGAERAVVAEVHVPLSRLVQWKTMGPRDLVEEWGEGMDPGAAAHAVDAVVESLKILDPGKYLLRHDAGGKGVGVWEEAGVELPPGWETSAGPRHDLHAAQACAGEIDTAADPFVPPRWRPYREDVAQVPFTFPPQVGGRDKGGPRRRQRKLAWQGDMDQVQHVATISRLDYEAGLAGGLDDL